MPEIPIEQLKKHVNEWVALSEPDEQVVGAGQDIVSAEADAKKHGYKGELTFFKVFPFGQYIPHSYAVSLPESSPFE